MQKHTSQNPIHTRAVYTYKELMAAQQLNAMNAHPVFYSRFQRALAILQSIRPKPSTANKTFCFQSYAHFKTTRTLSQQHDALADDINTSRKLEPSI